MNRSLPRVRRAPPVLGLVPTACPRIRRLAPSLAERTRLAPPQTTSHPVSSQTRAITVSVHGCHQRNPLYTDSDAEKTTTRSNAATLPTQRPAQGPPPPSPDPPPDHPPQHHHHHNNQTLHHNPRPPRHLHPNPNAPAPQTPPRVRIRRVLSQRQRTGRAEDCTSLLLLPLPPLPHCPPPLPLSPRQQTHPPSYRTKPPPPSNSNTSRPAS